MSMLFLSLMRLPLMRTIFVLIFLFLSISTAFSQEKKEPVQISGIVITADSIPQFIPYVHAVVKGRRQGTTSNAEGFFSFAALPGDTIRFTSLGFKAENLILPDTMRHREYLAKVVMKRDTTLLEEVTLYPWPTPERFKEEFLATRIPTTEEDIAMRNLAVQELKARAYEMGYSPEEMQDFMIQMQNQNIYDFGRYSGFSDGGTALLGSLTNPFAWARFFEALKNDEFRSQTPRKR
jgi:hypothetical protein